MINCPACKKGYIKEGESLQDIFPEIAKWWHPTKNNSLKPSEVGSMSKRVVWWICENNHEWQQVVQDKVKSPNISCRVCHIKDNSIGGKYPELLQEWDYTKNVVSPFETFCSSRVRVYWMCKNGHSLHRSPDYKIKCSECPYCVGRLATKNNNLGILYPHLIKQWDYLKNEYSL